ncbi:MAG: hypothetical protein R2705_12800 [Ilumatobacteraceae bacterium]
MSSTARSARSTVAAHDAGIDHGGIQPTPSGDAAPTPSAAGTAAPTAAAPTPGAANVLRSENIRILREAAPNRELQRLAVDLDGARVSVSFARNGLRVNDPVGSREPPGGLVGRRRRSHPHDHAQPVGAVRRIRRDGEQRRSGRHVPVEDEPDSSSAFSSRLGSIERKLIHGHPCHLGNVGYGRGRRSSADIFGGMGPDMFLKLLVAQLQYQNPMRRLSDPSAMLVGRHVRTGPKRSASSRCSSRRAGALGEVSQAATSSAVRVTAQGPAGEVSGTVTAARFTDAGPILVLDSGAEVSLSSIASIGGSSAAPAATSGTSTGSSGTTGSTGETAATSTTGTTATRSTSSAADSTATPDTATPDSATTDNPTTDNTTPDTSTSAPTDTSDETATPATSQASQMLAGAMARSNAADAA